MKNTQPTTSTSNSVNRHQSKETRRNFALLDMVDELCFTVDHDFRITYVNRYTMETFDKTEKELIGLSLLEIFPYSKGMFDLDRQKQRLSSGQNVLAEIQSPLSGCWYHITSCLFEDEYLIFMKETTTAKRYDELLCEKDALFFAITSIMSESIVLVDQARRIRYTTPSICQLTGFTSDELEGRKLSEFTTAEQLETVRSDLDALIKTPGKSASFKIILAHKDGSVIELNATGQNMLNEPGIDGILLKLVP